MLRWAEHVPGDISKSNFVPRSPGDHGMSAGDRGDG